MNSDRVINLLVVLPSYGSIYLYNGAIGDASLNAGFIKQWLLDHTKQFDLSRVSSLTTDTCSTMRSTWRELEALLELQHALFVPCDSHGLQLVIKDFLGSAPRAGVIKQAQTIVSYFHTAKKQYAKLRLEMGGKPVALILSVITRWGTQLALVKSLLKARDALIA